MSGVASSGRTDSSMNVCFSGTSGATGITAAWTGSTSFTSSSLSTGGVCVYAGRSARPLNRALKRVPMLNKRSDATKAAIVIGIIFGK